MSRYIIEVQEFNASPKIQYEYIGILDKTFYTLADAAEYYHICHPHYPRIPAERNQVSAWDFETGRRWVIRKLEGLGPSRLISSS